MMCCRGEQTQARRIGFTLTELLVVIAIIGVLMGLLLPAVQKVREAANRARCQNNLKQLGLAIHHFHDANGCLPPGMVYWTDVQDSYHTGYTYMLPYLEQQSILQMYDFTSQWFTPVNYAAVAQQVPLLFCPSNRTSGIFDLTICKDQWGPDMPDSVGACDYVFCHGASAQWDLASNIPAAVAGMFNICQFATTSTPSGPSMSQVWFAQTRLTDVTDGLSNTFAIGEAAGGNPYYTVRDLKQPTQPVLEPFANGPAVMEQSWCAASGGDPSHPWYACIWGVTAQYGMPPDYQDEPMNQPLGAPGIIGYIPGYPVNNLLPGASMSGFRSMHGDGCNFLFGDASVHYIARSVAPAVYRALSTYQGGEVVANDHY